MDYRFLGASGFKVSALGFGAGTFGGKGPFFSAWGNTDVEEARRLIDVFKNTRGVDIERLDRQVHLAAEQRRDQDGNLDFVAKNVIVTGEVTEKDGQKMINVKSIKLAN